MALNPGELYLPTDSLVANDTIEPEPLFGIILSPPVQEPDAPLRNQDNLGMSLILTGLFVLFLIASLRFRNNIKYAVTMFRNVVETRTRQNVFDDTVRETSLIVFLNILWCAWAGIIGYCVFDYLYPDSNIFSHRPIGMLCGMMIALAYTIFMWWAYAGVGWVFSDKSRSELWVKGYSASQAIMTPAFYIFALIGICRPEAAMGVGYVSALVFILAKLIFIWKGYRIFFSQFLSWVLFLCYLCSLEIVPLILCYRSAVYLGRVL